MNYEKLDRAILHYSGALTHETLGLVDSNGPCFARTEQYIYDSLCKEKESGDLFKTFGITKKEVSQEDIDKVAKILMTAAIRMNVEHGVKMRAMNITMI